MNFLCVCVRIPKSGSTSLHFLLEAAFAGRQTFYVPHTLNLDGRVSRFQDLRFLRSRARHLIARYRTASIGKAFGIIAARARDGDLINGGHIDFPSVQKHLPRDAKLITVFREPAARSLSEYNYCRQHYLRGGPLKRLDSGMRHKAAGRYSFDGFLDFLIENRDSYSNIAARYIGWDGEERLDSFFAEHVFHSGVLEDSESFERGLARKMGVEVAFPHRNRTCRNPATSTLTPAQRTKIEQLYPRDFELYDWQLAQA
jgi:hypothetical protein